MEIQFETYKSSVAEIFESKVARKSETKSS